MNPSQLITNAIDELLQPSSKLKDVLLKVKAVAYLIENEGLKEWIAKELDGYTGKGQVPDYRKVAASPRGNLMSEYGNQLQRNQLLLTEYLGEETHRNLTHRYLPFSVAELENLVENRNDEGEVRIDIPHIIYSELNKKIYSKNDWFIHSAWQLLAIASVEGVLTTIRSKLLDLLMPIKVAFGDDIPLQSLQQKQSVNDTVNKALHSISVGNGGTVIVSHGERALQAVNTGSGAVNAATGNNAVQSVSANQTPALAELIQKIRNTIESSPELEKQREEIDGEISRIEVQLKREEPKKGIISRSIETLNELAAGAAGTAAGHAMLELLKQAPALLQ